MDFNVRYKKFSDFTLQQNFHLSTLDVIPKENNQNYFKILLKDCMRLHILHIFQPK